MGFLDKLFGGNKNTNNNANQQQNIPAGPQVAPASMNKNGTMFRISRPYGYHIPDVDQVIAKYNNVFTELKNTIMSIKNENARLLNENKQVKSELRNMQMQMSMLQLPDTSEVQDHVMLDKMKQITGEKRYDFSDLDSEFKPQEEKQAKAEEELNKTIENVSSDSNPIILDNDTPPAKQDSSSASNVNPSIFDIID